MADESKQYRKLKKELGELQRLADDQKSHYVKSTQLLYEGLSRVYLWWRTAQKEDGLLEKLYSEYSIQFKQSTKQEIAFSPLLKYLWNNDGSLKVAKIDQYNRALNALHKEFILNRQYFRKNTLQKLISLISDKGGIIEMAGYRQISPDSIDEKKLATKPKIISKQSQQKIAEDHLQEGLSYFSDSLPVAKINTKDTLSRIDSGLSLAIIRKEANGYSVLSTIDDSNLINQAVEHSYRRTGNKIPYTLRLITEIIRTQTLPSQIGSLASSLVDECNYKPNKKPLKRKQLKRLLYIASEQLFILSANRSTCSVVTTVKPIKSIFKKKEKNDLTLAVVDRTYIENNLIHTNDFNFYTTDCKRYVCETIDEVASYKMKVENSITHDFRFIRFYHRTDFNNELSRKQAIVKQDSKFKPAYKVTLSPFWVKEMENNFLIRWVNGFGEKMKRAEHNVLKLTLGKTSIAVHFNKMNGKYDANEI
ncbi:hypothetical protein, partial [Solemya elarraichensis gill symbiont]